MGKPRMTRADAWRKRDCVEKYYMFKDFLNLNAQGFKIKPGMNYKFIIAMPMSWSDKKKDLMNGQPCCSKPDLDNLIKGLWDSLCTEDKDIYSIGSALKQWGYEGSIIIGD